MAKIMVVDDEEDIRDSVKALLDSEGYEVETAQDGNDCLKKLSSGAKPDLILMDFFMPGLSGRETIAKIQQNPDTKGIKIIFLTVAEFKKKGVEKLSELNISDYIQKPIDILDFTERVKKVLDN